ncbi:MAG: hypothetical protein GX793_01590 [Bacteroidales bacterium]|nr:hypothetical protein [Bacteroidales bacterium]MCK9499723.1 hypothetical protein [Bacteroidales bacterium]MDY0314418.1 hypothetical protein [Bacteroidales bacterium]NLB85732.1 hypothetical protein [Bacteroidales bacterium]
MDFSFAKDSAYVLLKHLSSLFPAGVDIYSYYLSENTKIYKAEYKNSNINLVEINTDEDLNQISNLRKPKKVEYSWEIEYDILQKLKTHAKQDFQFSIDTEEQRLNLNLRFNSPFDDQHDIVFLVFKQDLGFMGIDLSRSNLNTEYKKLIANIIYKSCISVLTQAKQDKQAFSKFTKKTKLALSSFNVYKDKLEQLREEHHKNIINLANNFIQDLSKKLNCNFIFTNQCIEALKDFASDLPRLQAITESAAIYAYNLNFPSSNNLITIEAEYLLLSDSDILKTKTENIVKPEPGFESSANITNIESYLNKIEIAVRKCLANKMKPIGVNVANFMEPAVSSASITMYLKKNSEEINKILDEDSSIFPQARKYFKPLQNVVHYNPLSEKLTG